MAVLIVASRTIFYGLRPWYLRFAKVDSCLCSCCENYAGYMEGIRIVRDESDAERRTFYEPSDEDEAGSVIPVNSTELRHAGFGLTVLEPSIRTACNAELESDVEDGGDVNGEDEWEDDDGESGDEVIDDRIEEDSAYVHGRRLVLSVADEQTALGRCWPVVIVDRRLVLCRTSGLMRNCGGFRNPSWF